MYTMMNDYNEKRQLVAERLFMVL